MSDLALVFPIKDLNDHPGPVGLSLRDYFAAAAMRTMIQRELHWGTNYDPEIIATDAYVVADAMLAERNR